MAYLYDEIIITPFLKSRVEFRIKLITGLLLDLETKCLHQASSGKVHLETPENGGLRGKRN